jgi:hypothetical protein
MKFLKKPHLPFWADDPDSPNLKRSLLKELQHRSSRRGEAVVFDGLNSIGQPTFRRVPHNYPRSN